MVPTQSQGGERQVHQRCGDKNRYHTKCNRHPGMHPNIINPASISTGQTPPTSKNIIISGWPSTKVELHSNLRPYWSYRDDLAVIDGVVMKGRCIIIPAVLKQEVLDQLHLNHMGSKKQSHSCVNPYIGLILIQT